MLITIVVPIYNVEHYIECCLNSVVNQTYKGDIECIIVNDATLDSSAKIAQEFIDNYSGRIRFKLVEHEMNLGLSEARNTGVKYASGEYVLFLDSDDELEVNAIDDLVNPIRLESYDVVVGSYSIVSNGLKPIVFDKDVKFSSNVSILQAFLDNQWYVMAWNKLCRRKFLIEQDLFFLPGLIHEDELWSFQLANKANSMYITSARTYKYNIRGSSIMQGASVNLKLKFQRKIILYEKIEEYILGKDYINITDYRYAEQKLINILNDLYAHRNHIPLVDLYRSLHEIYTFPLYIKSIGLPLNLKHIFRDFHLFIPRRLGYLYWQVYRCIIFKFKRETFDYK